MEQNIKPSVSPHTPSKPVLCIARFVGRALIGCGPGPEVVARGFDPVGTLSDEPADAQPSSL